MFGNPQWFRPKAVGFGLVPTSWQGWAFSGAWLSTIGIPFWVLTTRHQAFEALIWLLMTTIALTYEVWQMWQTLRRPHRNQESPNAATVRLSCRGRD